MEIGEIQPSQNDIGSPVESTTMADKGIARMTRAIRTLRSPLQRPADAHSSTRSGGTSGRWRHERLDRAPLTSALPLTERSD
jgi:hypothetical protein